MGRFVSFVFHLPSQPEVKYVPTSHQGANARDSVGCSAAAEAVAGYSKSGHSGASAWNKPSNRFGVFVSALNFLNDKLCLSATLKNAFKRSDKLWMTKAGCESQRHGSLMINHTGESKPKPHWLSLTWWTSLYIHATVEFVTITGVKLIEWSHSENWPSCEPSTSLQLQWG